jgi:hypothetical protein
MRSNVCGEEDPDTSERPTGSGAQEIPAEHMRLGSSGEKLTSSLAKILEYHGDVTYSPKRGICWFNHRVHTDDLAVLRYPWYGLQLHDESHCKL